MRETEAGGPSAVEDTEREPPSASTFAPDPVAKVDLSTDSFTLPASDPLILLLVRWEEAVDRGEDPDPEALCGDDLRWLPELRERIAKRRRLRAILAMPTTPEADRVDGPPPDFPGHEVLGQLGRGGMGIVYRARDVRLGRIVALKTFIEARYAAPAQVERFLDEARAVARLRHPNIVAIHAIGEHEGRPYLSLEYVDGGSLAHRLAGGPMAPRPAGELVETVARAIEAAHRAGVVHRDLKPGNILLTAEGVPKVGDFGLAKLMDSDSALTGSGQVMGTPSYMAPEQAEGHSSRVGPAADVYAMGAILYQALTGRPPFLGDSALETMRLVTTTEAVPPTRLRPDVPRDLETICLRCLEKDPARRYESAAGLADDLRRFLDGRPILARPVGAPGRLLRWAGRNRTLAAVSALLVAAFALGTPGFFALWLAARADRARAEESRGKALAALAETERAHQQADAARSRAEAARDRAVNAIRGLVFNESGDLMLEEARPYRQALSAMGLREAQELVRALEGDPQSEIQLIYGHLALAGVQLDSGQPDAAAESGRKALALAEALDARRHSRESRGALAGTLHRLTALPGSSQDVRDRALRSNALFEALDAERPDGPMADAHGIALNDHNIGHTWFLEKHLVEAAAAFEAGIKVCEGAIRRGDQGPLIRSDLARILMYLGRVRLHSGRAADAVGPIRRAIATYRELLDQSPSEYSYVNPLYLAHEELAFAYQGLNRTADAIACHEEARATLEAVAKRHRGVVSRMAAIQGTLARVDFNLANAYGSDPPRYYGKARAMFAESYDICDKLELVQPLSDDLKMVLVYALYQKADFRIEDAEPPDPSLLERAEPICRELCVKQAWHAPHRVMLATIRHEMADELEAMGRPDEARAWRDRAASGARGDGAALFDAATVAADNAQLTGTYPTRLDARRLEARRKMFIRRAVVMIRQAVAEGFRDAARLRRAPELAILGDDPEFRSIVASLDDRAFPAEPFAARP